jgi:dolichol-phosphate mannosyltransferase
MKPVVVVPTYNERENLPDLVTELLRISGLGVIVVDDNSPDGTGELADRLAAQAGGRVSVLHRTGARGFGRSYIDGMQLALRNGASHICQMDADFSHDPNDIPRLLSASGQADLVVASRYVPGGAVQNWPAHRRALSLCGNWYVRAITHLPVEDATSGFRCWRSELLQRLPLDRIGSNGYAFQIEMVWEAARVGARITEIPITFVERRLGVSKMTGGVIAEAVWLPWRLVAGRSARPRRGSAAQ